MFALGERRILRTLRRQRHLAGRASTSIFQTAFSVVLPEGILKGVLR